MQKDIETTCTVHTAKEKVGTDMGTSEVSEELEEREAPTPDGRIELVVQHFQDRLDAIRLLADTQLRYAKDNKLTEITKLSKRVSAASLEMQKDATVTPDQITISRSFEALIQASARLATFQSFPQEELLAETILVSVFSTLDGYLGSLLRLLFEFQPELVSGDEQVRQVSFEDVLSKNRAAIVEKAIDKVVESLLRESYAKSFSRIANRFSISTLTEFDHWPKFVECSQRRNLIVHCGGVVSEQYVLVCTEHKAHIGDASVGSQLKIDGAYLSASIDLVEEVGLMLGQVLWRRRGPDSIDAADRYLGDAIFRKLKNESWGLAKQLGVFANTCDERKYDRPRREKALKIIKINYAQAAKWSGDEAEARKIVDSVDWSGSGKEFQLAVACLKEEWPEAEELMRQIGPASPELAIHAYDRWPVFRQFRQTAHFPAVFKEVFGIEWADENRAAKGTDEIIGAGRDEAIPSSEDHDAERPDDEVATNQELTN